MRLKSQPDWEALRENSKPIYNNNMGKGIRSKVLGSGITYREWQGRRALADFRAIFCTTIGIEGYREHHIVYEKSPKLAVNTGC